VNKSDISKKFAELRKYGAKVYNFQSHKKMLGNCKGFADIVVIHNWHLFFLEIKTLSTKDKPSKEQKEFAHAVKSIGSQSVWYYEVNENNYSEIVNYILQ
jgi:hypothetical protein